MYSRQETSKIKKEFWTRFGQYMRPLPGASGEPINWLNYKTGRKHIYFRMDADRTKASIAIELRHPDAGTQQQVFEQMLALKEVLRQFTNEDWQQESLVAGEDGSLVSRIYTELSPVNTLNESDWPAIISFLKPRIMALDEFWDMAKERFS